MADSFRALRAPRIGDGALDVNTYLDLLADHVDQMFQELERISEQQRPSKEPYTISNPTTLRTLDVSAGTLADLRQVVGTLITDLKTKSILRGKA